MPTAAMSPTSRPYSTTAAPSSLPVKNFLTAATTMFFAMSRRAIGLSLSSNEPGGFLPEEVGKESTRLSD